MNQIPFSNGSLQLLCMPRALKRTYYRMCPDPDAYRFGVIRMSTSIFVEMWVPSVWGGAMKAVHWSRPEKLWSRMSDAFEAICYRAGARGIWWLPAVAGFGADLNIDTFVSGEMLKWTRFVEPR